MTHYRKYRDNFPPNRFLKKTIMRTVWHTMGFLIGLYTTIMLGAHYFPVQVKICCLCILALIPPLFLAMLIWDIIWTSKNPYIYSDLLPRPKCDKCHQNLPQSQDE